MYKVLQDGSTLFGLAVVAVWIWMWYRATEPHELPAAKPYSQAQIRVITMVVPVLALVGGMLKAYMDMGIPDIEFRPILHFAVVAGITSVSQNQAAPSCQPINKCLTRNEATTIRTRLCIHPVCHSSRMPASTSG